MLDYLIGDVTDRMAEIPDASIDLIVTSPPFLALRSYLPADHPDKGKEIGSEATPAAFLDRLLALTAEWGRVLAPHGSLCVELGDTYSGGVTAATEDRRVGDEFNGTSRREQASTHKYAGEWANAGYGDGFKGGNPGGPGWPLAKSLTGIPTLYPWSLAYGRNLLTGQPSPAGQWRIRNIIVWARPNPPVGALGDKFRPATSYITVACRGAKRFFDLDAVRGESPGPRSGETRSYVGDKRAHLDGDRLGEYTEDMAANGAPPLDWHQDEDGDWLWKLPTQPYKGAHYATFPLELPTRLIMAMCPLRVCVTCGKPSERIVGNADWPKRDTDPLINDGGRGNGAHGDRCKPDTTLGWSDCGHNSWRTGRVLDPFAGSGTTLQAAQNVGRHATGIDFDPRNGDLARDRVGMFLEVNP